MFQQTVLLPGLNIEETLELFLHMARNACVKTVKGAANKTPSCFVGILWYLDMVIKASLIFNFVHFLHFVFFYSLFHDSVVIR